MNILLICYNIDGNYIISESLFESMQTLRKYLQLYLALLKVEVLY